MTENLRNNLLNHLQEIARERHPYLASGGHFYVQTYIRQQLSLWGEMTIHEFIVSGKVHKNLILNLPAATPANGTDKVNKNPRDNSQGDSQDNPKSNLDIDPHQPLIIIGAHYDGVPNSPAADDNGTGVAVLLELARIIAAEPLAYPVQLIAFDLEEFGLLGSAAYVETLKAQERQVRIMLSLEMLGYCDRTPNSQTYPAGLERFYPNTGDFIALIGNFSLILDLMKMGDEIRRSGTPCEWLPMPNQGRLVPATRLSDHAPFWDAGYPAVMVTDTAFMRNPHYHKESDRLDTLDLDFLTGVCEGLALAIRKL
ncbi:MAG: M28 family peptidase [Coleofasciculaceae cyanobacterium SM2_1_6]|nr:M28 family peptidase [Coleofasciculaceae cyanobacterium SM2_1_6]